MLPGKGAWLTMSHAWNELQAAGGHPTLQQALRDRPDVKAGQMVLVPTVEQVEALIREIPHGQTRAVRDLRADLADVGGAEAACAVATGFHLRVIAVAVRERLAAGASPDEVTPIWRVLDESSPLLRELTAGPEELLVSLRRAEA